LKRLAAEPYEPGRGIRRVRAHAGRVRRNLGDGAVHSGDRD
jgi:hypothetical protein